MSPTTRRIGRLLIGLLTVLVLIATLANLGGCGGGDPEPEPAQPTPRVDCTARPELCA